jgi:hypothetical protein
MSDLQYLLGLTPRFINASESPLLFLLKQKYPIVHLHNVVLYFDS